MPPLREHRTDYKAKVLQAVPSPGLGDVSTAERISEAMGMKKIVALLDSMWSWGGCNEPGEEAPRYFRINPDNHSGRRLYRICGPGHSLLVTNCCRIVQSSANHHGLPDPEWVGRNIAFLAKEGMDLLLICGKVAKQTYLRRPCGWNAHYPAVLYMDHPAARRWSNQKIDETAALVAAMLSPESCIAPF